MMNLECRKKKQEKNMNIFFYVYKKNEYNFFLQVYNYVFIYIQA